VEIRPVFEGRRLRRGVTARARRGGSGCAHNGSGGRGAQAWRVGRSGASIEDVVAIESARLSGALPAWCAIVCAREDLARRRSFAVWSRQWHGSGVAPPPPPTDKPGAWLMATANIAGRRTLRRAAEVHQSKGPDESAAIEELRSSDEEELARPRPETVRWTTFCGSSSQACHPSCTPDCAGRDPAVLCRADDGEIAAGLNGIGVGRGAANRSSEAYDVAPDCSVRG